jgi:succinate dehydrogenase flavin-adding protein (antitoxin of CptAB toxin-antitoxin module)
MLDWNAITPQELRDLNEKLSDSRIAEMYGVSVGRVRYKRRKFGITWMDRLRTQFYARDADVMQKFNDSARKALLENPDVDMLAKAITQYAFRSGVVENMHVEGKLTDADMKELNIFFSNRIAGILVKAFADEWLQILFLFDFYKTLAADWDKVEPDVKEFEMGFAQRI